MNKEYCIKLLITILCIFCVFFSKGAEALTIRSPYSTNPLYLKGVDFGNDLAKNSLNLEASGAQNALSLSSKIAEGEFSGLDSLLSESIYLYKEAIDLLDQDLVLDLRNISDKKAYLVSFIDILDANLEALVENNTKIKNKLSTLESRDQALSGLAGDTEDLVIQNFEKLRWQKVVPLLQDKFFIVRSQYLNNKSYLVLYERLSRGYEKIIPILQTYRNEILANEEALLLGVEVVRFENARLDLVRSSRDLLLE